MDRETISEDRYFNNLHVMRKFMKTRCHIIIDASYSFIQTAISFSYAQLLFVDYGMHTFTEIVVLTDLAVEANTPDRLSLTMIALLIVM